MKSLFCFKRVMMIDDDHVCRLLTERMFRKYDFAGEIISCESGIEALNYLSTNQCLLPDLIFLDINMPEMDGFEFLEKFDKLNKEIKEHPSIIILTSSEDSEDVKKAEENKYVNLFLTKPLTNIKLETIKVAKHNGKRQ